MVSEPVRQIYFLGKGCWRYENQGPQEMAFGSLKGRIVLSSEAILHTSALEEKVKLTY